MALLALVHSFERTAFVYAPSGGIVFSGSATIIVAKTYVYTGSGGLALGGGSQAVREGIPFIRGAESTSGGPYPSLSELLQLDSPLTLDEIRRKLRPPVMPAQVRMPPPLPYLPLAPTMNLMIPDDIDEELLLHVISNS